MNTHKSIVDNYKLEVNSKTKNLYEVCYFYNNMVNILTISFTRKVYKDMYHLNGTIKPIIWYTC